MADYNMFEHLKTHRDLLNYTLFRGTTDFSRLDQFDMYESGYPYLVVVSIPQFFQKMMDKDEENVGKLIRNYIHILEYEFRGLNTGLEDMSTETQELNNGFQSMNVITKSNAQGGGTISMEYTEKSGAILTKVHELYLRSVRDPASGFKTYNGIIGAEGGILPEEAGFDKECFSFLYMHTDNTGLMLERAVYYVGCMPTSAQLSIYNGTKGNVEFQTVSCEFSAFPIMGKKIDKKAKEILDWMNSEANSKMVQRNSWNYDYHAVTDNTTGLGQTKLTNNN